MAIVRAPFPRLQFKSDDGSLMAFCWLKVFIAGTNTQIRTYKNESGTLNPIEIQLDNRGECDAWIDDDKKYRFELWSVDRKRLLKVYKSVSAGYAVEGVPNMDITSPNNTINVTSSVDPETNKKTFNIDVNGNNIDIIKWSDVLAADDQSAFETRIQADLAADKEPVVLIDTDQFPQIATLGGKNTYVDGQSIETFSVFRTATNDRSFIEYVPGKGTSSLKYLDPILQNGNALYDQDTGLVSVRNNKNLIYTYTGTNTLNFVVSPIDGMAANFAVKITSTAQADGTVTVYKKTNGLYIPLMPSVAGGTTVEAGKTYQLTCVGDCWTLAEFEEPSAGLKTKIGDKIYRVVKIGSLYWMAENLDYNFNGLTSPATDDSETDPVANYYNGDSSTYGSNGLLYNGAAVLYLQEHRTELGLGGWRVPTTDDFNALFTAVGGASTAATKLKSTSGWDSGYEGTDDYGFSALGTGNFTALYTQPVSGFNYINAGKSACFATCTEDGGNVYQCTLWQDSGEPQMSYPAPKFVGCSIRLVKDV